MLHEHHLCFSLADRGEGSHEVAEEVGEDDEAHSVDFHEAEDHHEVAEPGTRAR